MVRMLCQQNLLRWDLKHFCPSYEYTYNEYVCNKEHKGSSSAGLHMSFLRDPSTDIDNMVRPNEVVALLMLHSSLENTGGEACHQKRGTA